MILFVSGPRIKGSACPLIQCLFMRTSTIQPSWLNDKTSEDRVGSEWMYVTFPQELPRRSYRSVRASSLTTVLPHMVMRGSTANRLRESGPGLDNEREVPPPRNPAANAASFPSAPVTWNSGQSSHRHATLNGVRVCCRLRCGVPLIELAL